MAKLRTNVENTENSSYLSVGEPSTILGTHGCGSKYKVKVNRCWEFLEYIVTIHSSNERFRGKVEALTFN